MCIDSNFLIHAVVDQLGHASLAHVGEYGAMALTATLRTEVILNQKKRLEKVVTAVCFATEKHFLGIGFASLEKHFCGRGCRIIEFASTEIPTTHCS